MSFSVTSFGPLRYLGGHSKRGHLNHVGSIVLYLISKILDIKKLMEMTKRGNGKRHKGPI